MCKHSRPYTIGVQVSFSVTRQNLSIFNTLGED